MTSFGWSAGDIIATISLVNRVVQCIGGAHDARDHFQELHSELQALSRALHEISELTKIPGQTPEIQALRFASCSCGETLQRFYEKIRPFEDALGTASKRSKLKAAPRMVRWELLIKKDVPELRSYLVAHVGSLNLRLSTALLKASSNAQLQSRITHNKQDGNAELLQRLAKEQAEMFEKISLIPTTDTVPQLDSLVTIAIGVWKSQNAILSHLAKASHTAPTPDLEHTWAQPPVKFEDALGRRFLIPSEYDWDMIEAIILAKFKNSPGCGKVRSGDYELFDPRTGFSISGSNFFGLVPGSYITMTIIIGRYRGRDLIPERCTRAGCRSSRIKMTRLGIATCMECQSVFRQARKVLPRPMKPIISDHLAGSFKTLELEYTSRMDIHYYKNISIYSVELPATPAKFREKYTRDYLPQLQLPPEETEQNIPQVLNGPSAQSVSREPSKITVRRPSMISRLFGKARGPESSEPKTTRDRNVSGIRSMLQRNISRTPAARLNFHSSAQERYSDKRFKKDLGDLGNGVTLLPQDIIPPPPEPVPRHLDSSSNDWSLYYDSRGFPLPPSKSSGANPHFHHLAIPGPPPPRQVSTPWVLPPRDPLPSPAFASNNTYRPSARSGGMYQLGSPQIPPPPPISPSGQQHMTCIPPHPPPTLATQPGPPARRLNNSQPSYDPRAFPLPPGDSYSITGTKAHDFDEQLLGVQEDSIGGYNPTVSIPPPSTPPFTSLPSTTQLPQYLSIGLDIESWTLTKVTLWLAEHNFSQDWITTFIALNVQGSTFLELGSGYGVRGNFGIMHQQIYPRLADECSKSGTGWDQAREREEGKRMRRLIRAIVAGRSMALPSSDTDKQLVSASITSYSDLQFPDSFVSTP